MIFMDWCFDFGLCTGIGPGRAGWARGGDTAGRSARRSRLIRLPRWWHYRRFAAGGVVFALPPPAELACYGSSRLNSGSPGSDVSLVSYAAALLLLPLLLPCGVPWPFVRTLCRGRRGGVEAKTRGGNTKGDKY